jgi:hypothetical protein
MKLGPKPRLGPETKRIPRKETPRDQRLLSSSFLAIRVFWFSESVVSKGDSTSFERNLWKALAKSLGNWSRSHFRVPVGCESALNLFLLLHLLVLLQSSVSPVGQYFNSLLSLLSSFVWFASCQVSYTMSGIVLQRGSKCFRDHDRNVEELCC